MKIGLISDIHADYKTLITVIKSLRDLHQVDDILCAGDLVGYGSHPKQVLEFLREQKITTVKGNHDSPTKDITGTHADYLQSLPFDHRAEYGDSKIYMCHGMPYANIVGFTERILDYEAIPPMIAKLEVNFVLAGHTHQIFCRQVGHTWICNPGSLYAQNHEGTTQTYGILDLDHSKFNIYSSVTQQFVMAFDVPT